MKAYYKTKPYTSVGIKRLRCFRCGDKSNSQWPICADNNIYRPLYKKCDILLNELILKFMRYPDRGKIIEAYKSAMELGL